jgi:hypothetical protein
VGVRRDAQSRTTAPDTPRDIVPSDLSGGAGPSSLGEGDGGRAALVLEGACLDGPGCSTTLDQFISLLYRYSDGVSTGAPVPIHLPSRLYEVVVVDGDDVAIVSLTGDDRLVLSRFDEFGELELGETELPLSYAEPRNSLGALGTAFAVGPGDYVIAYGTEGGGRLARITVTTN